MSMLTFPIPRTTDVLSADGATVLRRVMEISTPDVLENPGLEAWPPDTMAKGVRVEAIIFIYMGWSLEAAGDSAQGSEAYTTLAVSSVEPTSTTQVETWAEEDM